MLFPATFSRSKEAPVRSKLLDEMIKALAVTPCVMARVTAETNEVVFIKRAPRVNDNLRHGLNHVDAPSVA